MKKHHLFFILIGVVIILVGFNINKTGTAEGRGPIGTWYTKPPLCYKHMGPAGPKGLHLGVMSCNSGYFCKQGVTGPSNSDPYCYCGDNIGGELVPGYVQDCGPNNTKCNSPINVTAPGGCTNIAASTACFGNSKKCGSIAGCLNYICPIGSKLNAIWDYKTKKCGCG